MPQFGVVQRTKPRIRILRGYNPQDPSAPSRTAPVADGVTLQSGQIAYLAYNSSTGLYEWNLGWIAGTVPYIVGESGTDDKDVIDAEVLKCFDLRVPATIQTPYYKSGDTYNEGTPLSPDGTTGNLKAATLKSGEPIVGYITGQHGVIDISGEDSSAVKPANVIRFTTSFQINATDAT